MFPACIFRLCAVLILVGVLLSAGCTQGSGSGGGKNSGDTGIREATLYHRTGALNLSLAWNGLDEWAQKGYYRQLAGELQPVPNRSADAPVVYYIQGVAVSEAGNSNQWLFGISINGSAFLAEYAGGEWTLREMPAPLPGNPVNPAAREYSCRPGPANRNMTAAIFSPDATPAVLELQGSTCTLSSRNAGVMHVLSFDAETGTVTAGL